jgi:hypothetical protein
MSSGPADVAASRATIMRSSWRGAKTGFRWVSYIAGPLAAVPLLLGLGMLALGAGAGGGWVLPALVLNAFGFFFACGLYGGILGAVIGLIVGLFQRARPGTLAASVCAAANRPIRFSRKSPSTATPVDSDPPGFLRKYWPWLVGVPVLGALVAAYVMGGYMGRMVDRRLNDAVSAADKDDPNWRLDDLWENRQPVPDAENSALIVAQALSKLPESWPSGPAPPPGQPKQAPSRLAGTYDQLGASAANIPLSAGAVAVIRDELEKHAEAVRIARSVAGYPRGRHELELGPTLIDTPLPETQAARTAARLMTADAAIRAHNGDADGAIESCRATLSVGRSIGDEPFTISQLVWVAIGSVAMNSIRRTLALGEPSEQALAGLQALAADELAQPLLVYGMKRERAVLTELLRRIRDDELPFSALSDSAPPPGLNASNGGNTPWGKLWYGNQMAIGLEWMNQAIAIARRPSGEQVPLWEEWQSNIERVKRSRFGIYTATLPLLMMPAMSSASNAHSRLQSELGATIIVLAAERHRRKTGDWPASIAAIDRAILPNPPSDPFSGQAFRMEHRDGQLLIYSIGPNRRDEHGAYDPKQWAKKMLDDHGSSAWDKGLRGKPR